MDYRDNIWTWPSHLYPFGVSCSHLDPFGAILNQTWRPSNRFFAIFFLLTFSSLKKTFWHLLAFFELFQALSRIWSHFEQFKANNLKPFGAIWSPTGISLFYFIFFCHFQLFFVNFLAPFLPPFGIFLEWFNTFGAIWSHFKPFGVIWSHLELFGARLGNPKFYLFFFGGGIIFCTFSS